MFVVVADENDKKAVAPQLGLPAACVNTSRGAEVDNGRPGVVTEIS